MARDFGDGRTTTGIDAVHTYSYVAKYTITIVESFAATDTGGILVKRLPPGGMIADDDTSVHQVDIEGNAGAGTTMECEPPLKKRFCPIAPATRGQMASILTRSLGIVAVVLLTNG